MAIAVDVQFWLMLCGRAYEEIWKHKCGPAGKQYVQ